MDKMRELKPCPFCGGPVELEKTIDGRAWYGVVCRNTFNRGGTCAVSIRPSASEECAIERWNMRAQSAAVPVAGEVVGWITSAGYHFWPSDKVKNPDNFVASGMRPLIVKPTTSITAAELAKIRAYIADGIESEGVTEHDHSIEARKLVKIIDAAIAGEKNHG